MISVSPQIKNKLWVTLWARVQKTIWRPMTMPDNLYNTLADHAEIIWNPVKLQLQIETSK